MSRGDGVVEAEALPDGEELSPVAFDLAEVAAQPSKVGHGEDQRVERNIREPFVAHHRVGEAMGVSATSGAGQSQCFEHVSERQVSARMVGEQSASLLARPP